MPPTKQILLLMSCGTHVLGFSSKAAIRQKVSCKTCFAVDVLQKLCLFMILWGTVLPLPLLFIPPGPIVIFVFLSLGHSPFGFWFNHWPRVYTGTVISWTISPALVMGTIPPHIEAGEVINYAIGNTSKMRALDGPWRWNRSWKNHETTHNDTDNNNHWKNMRRTIGGTTWPTELVPRFNKASIFRGW